MMRMTVKNKDLQNNDTFGPDSKCDGNKAIENSFVILKVGPKCIYYIILYPVFSNWHLSSCLSKLA